MEADYGAQTRLFHSVRQRTLGGWIFSRDVLSDAGAASRTAAGVEPSWQGYSIASWTIMGEAETSSAAATRKWSRLA